MAAATQSCLALIGPMAKRRSRVALTGPWPVRMRSRSSSKALSRMSCTDSTFQCPRLGSSSRRGSAVSGEWLVMPKASSTEVLPDFLSVTERSTGKAWRTCGKVRWPLSRSVVRMARLSRRPSEVGFAAVVEEQADVVEGGEDHADLDPTACGRRALGLVVGADGQAVDFSWMWVTPLRWPTAPRHAPGAGSCRPCRPRAVRRRPLPRPCRRRCAGSCRRWRWRRRGWRGRRGSAAGRGRAGPGRRAPARRGRRTRWAPRGGRRDAGSGTARGRAGTGPRPTRPWPCSRARRTASRRRRWRARRAAGGGDPGGGAGRRCRRRGRAGNAWWRRGSWPSALRVGRREAVRGGSGAPRAPPARGRANTSLGAAGTALQPPRTRRKPRTRPTRVPVRGAARRAAVARRVDERLQQQRMPEARRPGAARTAPAPASPGSAHSRPAGSGTGLFATRCSRSCWVRKSQPIQRSRAPHFSAGAEKRQPLARRCATCHSVSPIFGSAPRKWCAAISSRQRPSSPAATGSTDTSRSSTAAPASLRTAPLSTRVRGGCPAFVPTRCLRSPSDSGQIRPAFAAFAAAKLPGRREWALGLC